MKRSIQRTITPPGYLATADPKKHTVAFNKWATYIHKEVKRIQSKG